MLFQRLGENEFPFAYLVSINHGDCRLCDYSAGTMSTNQDVKRLQNHYLATHPMSFEEGL